MLPCSCLQVHIARHGEISNETDNVGVQKFCGGTCVLYRPLVPGVGGIVYTAFWHGV